MKKVSKNIIILICLIKFQNSINMEASKYINLYTLLVQQQDSNTFTYPAFPKQLLIYNNNSESLEENLKTTTTGSTDLQIKLPAEKEYIINITNTFNKKTILGLPFDSSAKGTSSYLGYSLYSKLQKEGFDIHGLENINPHNITEWPNTNINIFTTGKTSYNESGFEISKIGELCPKLIGLIKYIEIFNKKE